MKYFLTQLFLLIAVWGFSQGAIQGSIYDATGEPLSGVEVQLQPVGQITFTNGDGFFKFENLVAGEYILSYGQTASEKIMVSLEEGEIKILSGLVSNSATTNPEESTENIFDNLDVLETADETSSVSSMLSASRDVFMNKSGFQFGSDVFFRNRGYDTKYTDFMVNGIRLENPETGWQPFNLVGGLNDVLRYRNEETIGTNAMDKGLGEVGGAVNYNLRPSQYGHGGRVTYSNLNRSYNHRVMGTYASGETTSGWSYVASASKRWAEEGYVDGNYYDAYAGYLAVEKKVSDNYSVMASGMWSPRRRATNTIHTQEAYDLAGSNFYSADWGYQNGEKRNSRLRKNSNPVFMLANYVTISPKTELQLTGAYITGEQINTRINRFDASNPDPDYYRNMPSYAINYPSRARFEPDDAPFMTNKQLDWLGFYTFNSQSPDGVGYLLEDNYRADDEFQVAAQLHTEVDDNLIVHYGGNFKKYTGNFYTEAKDLLGKEFFYDVAIEENSSGQDVYIYNNAADQTLEDTKFYEGDKYGFDYDLNRQEYDVYVQGDFSYDKVDFFVGGSVGRSEYWREGNLQTGSFPDNSFGEGETKDFTTFGAKAGATYKLDGRNYFSANGMYYVKPPLMSTVWQAETTRDNFHPLGEEETIYSGELNYNHNAPNLKVRVTGYATRFENQAESLLGFSDTGVNDNTNFGFFYTHGIDKVHTGGEMGFEYKINPEWAVSGAAAVGKYTIMSRPLVSGYTSLTNFEGSGDSAAQIFPTQSSYLLDFYEDNTPQTAMNLGLTWRAPKRFILNVDGNYYDNAYAGPSAIRRTVQVAQNLEQVEGLSTDESIAYWTKQERLDEAFRLNLSLYKEIRFSYDKQIGINLSVNNVLDDEDYASLAFENIRVQDLDYNGTVNPNDFPTRYRYAYGRTYFLNVAYKFR